MATDDATRRLQSIQHIVVLMMENRSFDHMLGYLKQDGMPDVDGLNGDETCPDDKGNPCRVHAFPPGHTAFHKPGDPLEQSLDPCHEKPCVAEQLEGGNQGFVKNFIGVKKPTPEWRDFVMGHFTAEHLPVYDRLARTYAVCDRWFSSVPGDTWPNRLYALCGREAESLIGQGISFLDRLRNPTLAHLKSLPIYDIPAFTRHLRDEQWRWYAHDPATLRVADGRYRTPEHLDRDNFAYFDRKGVTTVQQGADLLFVTRDSFLDDAAHGQLRDVSWIDPNFINLHVFDTQSNDDHPPSDVKAGQLLVLDLYHALTSFEAWNDTLLVITYDEHGGFYDHVPPPKLPADDGGGFATYGVRVPALVIGPRVRQGVCSTTFDHTSLIRTILLRFADDPEAAIQAMGKRTTRAEHLGVVLQDEPRTDLPSHEDLRQTMDAWRVAKRTARAALPDGVSAAGDGAGRPQRLHEFQQGFVGFAQVMRELGLPPGQP